MPEYVQGADLPDLTFTWYAQDGTLIDLSTGYTFSLKIGNPGSAALITKTTGITGAATDPNVTIAWATSGELNTLAPGSYALQLQATRTADSKQRFLTDQITIHPGMT
jgi:hypothetical protein